MADGYQLMHEDHLPYTAQMIATITRQQIGTVETGLAKSSLKLGLVEVLDRCGTFYMSQHRTANRPVLYRGGAEKERAYAIEASK